MFSTGGGGVAGLGVVGITGPKARGVTGQGSPIGDSFWIDYVAHEIGHQFGGSHTFNSSTSSCNGNRSGSSAYEPGSGSTIQSYAGICAADNLQPNSDAMFHSRSIDQIRAYIATIPTVGTTSNTGNAEPTVNVGQDYVIPTRTPFELTAIGSEPDSGNVLSYSWEQRDLGVSTTLIAADNGQSPIFRTWNPTTDPTRVFPGLSDLVNNTVPIGEKLPTVNWNSSVSGNMDFRVVVRDNASGGGGVNWDDMNIQVVNVGATGFTVTSQNAGGSWTGNSAESITWDVAGTTASPINAVNVDIWLSTDGGLTYPTLLAGATANDGTEAITVPNIVTSQARIKVKATGNIFFDINDANINIVEDQGDCGGDITVSITPVNRGIAVTDDATGTGYFMYSEQSLLTRFGTSSNSNTPGVFANNAAHLVAVRRNGSQWQYNTNFAWRDFTPVVLDRLLAEVNGIKAGYVTGDLVFTPNMWNGVFNSGEFGVAGSFFDVCPA